jgi:hypothetical protein
LGAAVAFIQAHPGQVSPVTIDIGGDDLNQSHIPNSCAIDNDANDQTSFGVSLAAMDSRLTQTILPQLVQALGGKGDLVMLNYHDHSNYVPATAPPNTTASECPNSIYYEQQLNQHLAADAALVEQQDTAQIVLVDTWSSFPPSKTCTYTWWCTWSPPDLHPTTLGSSVMANDIETKVHY